MTTQSTEPPRLGPQWHTSSGQFSGSTYLAHSRISISTDEVLPIDPAARDIEIPRSSALFEHLAATAVRGGVVYLTLFGHRVAAVVPADVAESFERAEPDREPGAGLRELLADSEARLGPVPPEIAAEVDRQWDAALASM
jgi:hypothetical protein